jgi:hypothetical protein
MIRLGADILRTAAESASEHALIYCSMSREELRQAAMDVENLSVE